MHSPDQCDRVRTCPIHEQCFIGRRASGLSGSVLWTSRCGHGSEDCKATGISIDGVVGRKRSSVICSTCCSSNLCNNNCSIASPTTTSAPATTKVPVSKPVITYVSRSHAVMLGAQLHLTCRATGNPPPSISWNFFVPTDKFPNNFMVRNGGADVYIVGVTPENYGNYSCNASNSAGIDIRYVDISEPASG
ncbi:neuronal growth regulator 1-like [Pecten maximus]|uniref:neuronal growth regulator 1-like n=1 Tax=Pecten maximus TaxID=6579 RepID=UPI001457E6B3|nr:neuronal growth regulator 1-like [Pecten maximus]